MGYVKRLAGAFALLVLTMLLVAETGFLQLRFVYAQNDSDRLKQIQQQIDAAKDERDALSANVTDIKKVRDELRQNKEDLNSFVAELDAELGRIYSRIDDLENQIVAKRAQIDQTEAELEAAIGKQVAQYEAMKERIRFMYEAGNQLTIDLFLQAGSFTDMLNKATYIRQLSEYDRMKLDEYIAVVQQVTLTKQALEAERAVLDEAIAAQQAEQVNVQALATEKTAEIYGISEEIDEQERQIAAYQAMMADRDNLIAQLQEEARHLQYPGYDGGMFVWPCPNYSYISSDFGPRWGSVHKGVDMAAPSGTPILAAYNGVVIGCANNGGWNGGMGNYVMIDHGDGLVTIYMHASATYTSVGQQVSAGQQIAAVGTTGDSTGNHLHFQVNVSGQAVSPWGYITNPR